MGATLYERLLCEVRPEVIETDERYDEVSVRLAGLVRKGDRRTASETRLMRLLAVLVEDYDRRHALPPDDSAPADRLRYLLEVSGQTTAALIPVFGQRSHVNEALNGRRPISAEQARKLGGLFRVKPGLFV
ncbi:MAG: transcriptional regulator [Acidobacteria bacterium]|nr:transcriptional regulator [Acidobacteriota bacterium]